MDIRFGVGFEPFLRYIRDLDLNHVELTRGYLAGCPDAPTPTQVRTLAEKYDITTTYHAPFRDWNIGSYDETVRQQSVDRVKRSLDHAATAGADAVVVHGGEIPERYPEWIHDAGAENARRSLTECAAYADEVGVPLCLENQPLDASERRHTTTPDALATMLERVDADPDVLRVTLDVGHANVTGVDWQQFVDRFGDRIQVCHLHDNDGTGDQHEPLSAYDSLVETIPARQFVFEMKSLADVATCVDGSAPLPEE